MEMWVLKKYTENIATPPAAVERVTGSTCSPSARNYVFRKYFNIPLVRNESNMHI
jgi:hypothetical protein